MLPDKNGVTVRMYDTGFGDCFLLAFRAEDDTARYMLIDCGAHQSYSGGAAKLRKVAANIAEVTDNHLHVLVVTHGHWDHLAGFCRARTTFSPPMKIDELWLAWPENPEDQKTKELTELYGMQLGLLAEALEQLKQAQDPMGDTLAGIFAFDNRDLPFDEAGFDAGFEADEVLSASENTNEAQYQFLREHSAQAPPPYLKPGDPPLSLPGVEGMRIYVLGPPRDLDSLRETEPAAESPTDPSLLDAQAAFSLAVQAARGMDELGDDDREAYWRSFPFERRSPYRIPLDDLKNEKAEAYRPFFQAHYGFTEEDPGPAWRRIDTDWLYGALEIALRISAMVNNTSLVLAIELPGSDPRKVLLFAGDAQVGNWHSWSEVTWPGDAENLRVSGDGLVQRTVLYKVGHHGSHNATLTEYVEKMSPDLVAMIPVNQAWAKAVQGWEHPAKSVLDALEEKTEGRIIRMDEIPSGDEPPQKPSEVTETEWKAFTDRLSWDDSSDKLWIQYTVSG